MKRLCLIATISLVAGCSGDEPKSTTSGAPITTSTQVCTIDGKACLADCPATVEYNGSSCAFSASEQALRQDLSCSDGPTGRCYYVCTSTQTQGPTPTITQIQVLGTADAGVGSGSDAGTGSGSDAGTGSGSGSGSFAYSTASPVCTVLAACSDPDGVCDSACPGDPDCAPTQCDDHDACTINYLDANGQCQQDALPCDDNDACTTDSCDSALGCVHTPVTCDGGDVCTTSRCDSRLGCVAAPTECDDDNPCTVDTCSPGDGCSFTPVPDGTPCNDGNDDTYNDACHGGTCAGDSHCPTCCS